MSQIEGFMAVTQPSLSSFAFTQPGIFAIALHASYTISLSWIIDSKALDHMTGLSLLFYLYSITSGCDKIKVADGILSFISGKRSINVSLTLSLSSVLHVPKFANNLLLISRITCDLNCSITFFPSRCVF